MKKAIVVLLLLFFGISQAQEMKLLKKINGVEIYYELKKVKERKNKDSWVVFIEFQNTTGDDLFYKTLQRTKKNTGLTILTGKDQSVTYKDYHFAILNIENVNGFLASEQKAFLGGDILRLKTDVGENIIRIKKNKTYTLSLDFKANKGIEPIIRTQIVNNITFTDRIEDYF